MQRVFPGALFRFWHRTGHLTLHVSSPRFFTWPCEMLADLAEKWRPILLQMLAFPHIPSVLPPLPPSLCVYGYVCMFIIHVMHH